jgi:hypothetical protein
LSVMGTTVLVRRSRSRCGLVCDVARCSCIHYMQCCKPRCSGKIWPASDSLDLATLGVDHTTFRYSSLSISSTHVNAWAQPRPDLAIVLA